MSDVIALMSSKGCRSQGEQADEEEFRVNHSACLRDQIKMRGGVVITTEEPALPFFFLLTYLNC